MLELKSFALIVSITTPVENDDSHACHSIFKLAMFWVVLGLNEHFSSKTTLCLISTVSLAVNKYLVESNIIFKLAMLLVVIGLIDNLDL